MFWPTTVLYGMTIVCYQILSLHSVLSKAGKFEQAKGLFLELLERGIGPVSCTFEIILPVYARLKDTAGMDVILMVRHSLTIANNFQEMDKVGCTPSTLLCNTVLSIFRESEMYTDMLNMGKMMRKKGIPYDLRTYSLILGKINISSSCLNTL